MSPHRRLSIGSSKRQCSETAEQEEKKQAHKKGYRVAGGRAGGGGEERRVLTCASAVLQQLPQTQSRRLHHRGSQTLSSYSPRASLNRIIACTIKKNDVSIQWASPNSACRVVPVAGTMPVKSLGTTGNLYIPVPVLCPIVPVSDILTVRLAGTNRYHGRPPPHPPPCLPSHPPPKRTLL